jgi:pyruvate/2-oxoglutarate dehydrogenase complex dihydrolipoamide dehydrogenase (E3) component
VTVEYDLVIIGGGAAGRYAAAAAARPKARVALVEPPQPGGSWILANQALVEVGRVAHKIPSNRQFGVYPTTAEASTQGVSTRINQVMQWAEAVVSTLGEPYSPTILASLGVELIFGLGQFHNQPCLAFSVNGRQLQARAYLIATGVLYSPPDITGLPATEYITPDNILKKQWSQWPEDLVVIGGGPVGTELSQTFARLGSRVTLITSSSHILAQEDPEAAFLVQAQLEAEGIRVLTHSRVTQVRQVNGKKLVLIEPAIAKGRSETIEASEVLVTVGQQPNVEFLNLEAVGVKLNQQGVQVNDKLQTSNPRIYACGEVIGGYPLAHVANYEAQIALKNALFWPMSKVDYRVIPWAIFSDPELARVGLTEAQARRRYGQEIQVLQQFYKTVERAQLRGETTGFCKIIVRQDGTILGAHLVGPAAEDVIHAIALAMKHRLKVKALSDLVHISPTLAEISSKTASVWNNISQQPARRNFLESFFNLRRTWSS